MESHDPNQPKRPDEESTHQDRPPESEASQPPRPEPSAPAPEAGGPRRLFRSRDDRVIAGVCGGLGRYLGIDPIILRIAFVVLLVFGGVTALAYVAAVLLVPNEPEGGSTAGAAGSPGAFVGGGEGGPDRGRTVAIIAVAILLLVIGWPLLMGGMMLAWLVVPLAVLALVGLLVWWIVSGEGPGGDAADVARRSLLGVAVLVLALLVFIAGGWAAAAGGGAVAAGLVIAAGAALIVGAFVGRARVLIIPALALALGVGFVSAAGIDLDGGVGDRHYTPVSAADLSDGYELGMGELVVDLREAELPPGDTPLSIDVGMGDAQLIVPEDVCVATTASVGMGGVETFGDDDGGVDVELEERPSAAPGNSRVVVDADVGLGVFRVGHEPFDDHGMFGDRGFGDGGFDADEGTVANTGCAGDAEAADAGA